MSPPPSLHPERIRGLVFDLDGTLVDSYRAIAASLNHARMEFGLPLLDLEFVRRKVGRGLEALIAEMIGPALVEQGVRSFREHYATIYARQTDLLPGVAETLGELARRGYRMAVASNKPARFGRAIVDDLGIGRHFDIVQGPDLAGRTKPDPAMIRLCVQAMGVEASNAVYIGDMVLDVESGVRADLPVLLVSGGSSTDADLRRTGQPILAGFGDLLDLLPPLAEVSRSDPTR